MVDRHVDKIAATKSLDDEEKVMKSIETFKLEKIPDIMTYDLNKVFHNSINKLSC